MARRPTLRQQFDALLSQYDKRMQAAFLESVQDVKSRIVMKDLIARLEARDVEGALRVLNIDRAAFGPLDDVIREAYTAGGKTMAANMPTLATDTGARAVIRFDSRAVRAENYLRNYGADFVGRITTEQNTTMRGILETAMREGKNPRSTVSQIAGNYNRVTGKMDGGLIGLSPNQVQYVNNARSELGGTEKELRKFMARRARDKRFDRTIEKAIQEGKRLPDATIEKILSRYEAGLIQTRAEAIARTEMMTALQEGKREGFLQGIEKTNYPPEAVDKVWRSAGDGRVRHSHSALNGQVAKGLNAPFTSPSGMQLLHPGDRSLGADGSETIQCRCDVDYRIDYSYGVE